MRLRFTPNNSGINGLFGPSGPVYSAAVEASQRVVTGARAQAHRKTGELRGSIRALPPRQVGRRLDIVVEATAPHARIHHEGRRAITAKPGRRLVFQVGGKKVFAKHVRGVAPNRYLSDQLAKVRLGR